jgi:hypothetical protein
MNFGTCNMLNVVKLKKSDATTGITVKIRKRIMKGATMK